MSFVITGGLGGIGQAVARHFVAQGARVVITHRPGTDPVSMAGFGGNAEAAPLDVASERGWQDLVDGVVERHGKLDGLVNLAGVFLPGIPFEQMTMAQWRAHMDVNLDGTFLGCRTATAAMRKTGGGVIVNCASTLAEIMLEDAAAYCVSKAAVVALTRLAAKAGAKYGVRVNAVLPGAVDTPMLWRNLAPGQTREELLDMITGLHPIGRIATPDDVARAIFFLCDPASSFVTGALLAVDGGQLVG